MHGPMNVKFPEIVEITRWILFLSFSGVRRYVSYALSLNFPTNRRLKVSIQRTMEPQTASNCEAM